MALNFHFGVRVDVRISENWGLFLVTWAPNLCRIMAFMAIIMGLGLIFYILLGFR